MDTVIKRNISGEDLEVALLNYQTVKAGDTVELPVNYPWHSGETPAPVVYPEAVWEDVTNGDPQAGADEVNYAATQSEE